MFKLLDVIFPLIPEEKGENSPNKNKLMERKIDELSPFKRMSMGSHNKTNGNSSPGKKSIGKKQN
jgi:hypothetical protein